MLSEKAVAAIRLNQKRAYRIAQEAGLHPSTLSKWLNGIEHAKTGDPRISRLAAIIGLSEEEMLPGQITGSFGRS